MAESVVGKTPSTAQLGSRDKVIKKRAGGSRLARARLQGLHVCSSTSQVCANSRETGKKAGILPALLRASGGSVIPSCPHTRNAGPKKGREWVLLVAVGQDCGGTKMTE